MAIEIPDQLKEVADQVNQGHERTETVRTLLSWFGFERRGYSKVRQIRKALRHVKLRTEPDFEGAYMDASVIFLFRMKPGSDETSADNSAGDEESTVATSVTASTKPVREWDWSFLDAPVLIMSRAPADPTYRIGRLASANKRPVCVSPDALVEQATTLMLTNDFSQLPVMTGEREVKGLVSWKSLGSRLALGNACRIVRDCMDCPHEVNADTSLFEVIPLIAQHDCVLVRDSSNKISGVVTAADLSNQFGQLGEPFLLLGAIENHLRGLISGKFTKEELAAARDPVDSDREIEDVADLTLGEYLRLLQEPQKWGRLGVKIDRKTFTEDLDDIRRIRNDVMHFDPDGVGEDDLAMLRRFVQFLQRLRQLTPKSS